MRSASAIGIVLLLSGVSAFAQTSPPAPHPASAAEDAAHPCDSQYVKFCSDVPTGSGRKLLCMMKHLAQLTPACRTRTQIIYKLESDQAAARHMTVPEFMYWGQTLHEQAMKAHKSFKIVPATQAPGAASNTQPQPKPSNAQQN